MSRTGHHHMMSIGASAGTAGYMNLNLNFEGERMTENARIPCSPYPAPQYQSLRRSLSAHPAFCPSAPGHLRAVKSHIGQLLKELALLMLVHQYCMQT